VVPARDPGYTALPVRLFGRYQLVEPIASGGMAEVWRARATGPAGVEKEVALKLVRGEHGAGSDFARMLVEEARLAARLTHANVVQVFELVEEGGRHAIAMELVRGHDLGRVLERCRQAGLRLGLPRAVHLCVEVARALDYAHRLAEGGRPLGVVHRDVSPANVLVSFEGEVKLADFGIARAMTQAGLTDPGTVKGKLAYMAPEQARGERVDGRADVFALGVLCWELCAGRRLFARESDAATLAALLDAGPVSPPSAWNEAVPPGLDAAVLGALARQPSARTASAGDLGAALSAVLLRLVRTPEDLDLRGLMRRLWPEAPGPGAPAEPTAVRPPAAPGRPAGAADAGSAPTRTIGAAAAGGAGRRRRAAVVALAAALLAAGLLAAQRAPRGAPTAAAGPFAPAGPSAPAGQAAQAVEGPALAGGAGLGLELAPQLDEQAARRGEGRVLVSVHPWATVSVDGQPVGETPQDLRLPAGRHRLRAAHPTFGEAEVEVVIEPGRRLAWHPSLSGQ
jgi:tRNA A-37 threonylcarbamoyl transferase component Bud32